MGESDDGTNMDASGIRSSSSRPTAKEQQVIVEFIEPALSFRSLDSLLLQQLAMQALHLPGNWNVVISHQISGPNLQHIRDLFEVIHQWLRRSGAPG
jgi:hypothetical protein